LIISLSLEEHLALALMAAEAVALEPFEPQPHLA
jgi:hypothetical protein